MSRPIHRIAILMLALLAAAGAYAQTAETAVATETAAETAPAAAQAAVPAPTSEARSEPPSRQAIRENFTFLVDRHPPELGRILALDPSLLSNEPFLARYPEIAQFVAENPEVRRNPHYFVRHYEREPRRQSGPFEEVIEALSIAFVFALIAFALAWIIRTIIEQKRWNRLSRTQAEVHNKILDRFGSTDELLAYIKTPAGTKFLESAPIPLRTEPVAAQQNAPFGRAMWSVQVGVVVAAAGLGMLLVSLRFSQETSQELFAMGVIAFFIGAGFIGSAAVSIYMSRRLGLWQDPAAAPPETFNDSGVVR